jgi:hypothetical protein
MKSCSPDYFTRRGEQQVRHAERGSRMRFVLPKVEQPPVIRLANVAFPAREVFSLKVRNRFLTCATFAMATTIMMAASAKAQDAEPRAYANAPVGLNFLLAGYIYTQGRMAFDPSLAIADTQFHSHSEEAAYVLSFDFFGNLPSSTR